MIHMYIVCMYVYVYNQHMYWRTLTRFLPFLLPPRDLDETLLVHPSSPWRMEKNRGWKSRWRFANTCMQKSESKKCLRDVVCLFCTHLNLQLKSSIDSCFWIKASPDFEDLECACDESKLSEHLGPLPKPLEAASSGTEKWPGQILKFYFRLLETLKRPAAFSVLAGISESTEPTYQII